MKIKSLLINGVQIKRVTNGRRYGVIILPKELIGDYVKVSLLTEKEQLELQKRLENMEKLQKEFEEKREQLKKLKRELNDIRRLRGSQKVIKITRLSRIKSLKNEKRKTFE